MSSISTKVRRELMFRTLQRKKHAWLSHSQQYTGYNRSASVLSNMYSLSSDRLKMLINYASGSPISFHWTLAGSDATSSRKQTCIYLSQSQVPWFSRALKLLWLKFALKNACMTIWNMILFFCFFLRLVVASISNLNHVLCLNDEWEECESNPLIKHRGWTEYHEHLHNLLQCNTTASAINPTFVEFNH